MMRRHSLSVMVGIALFLVQASCTGTQSLRYQDPLRFAKTCDPTQVSPILPIIDGIAWTIVGSALLSGALLATLDDRHKHYVMVVGAPAIYGPVPMLVTISAWLPAYSDAQSRQDCHSMKELLQRDLSRYGGSTGWRLPEVEQ